MVDAKVLVQDLLAKVYSPETTKDERKKAEESLKSLSQFMVQHMQDLCDLIAVPNLQSKSATNFRFNKALNISLHDEFASEKA